MLKSTRVKRAIDTLRLFQEKVEKLLSMKFVDELRRHSGGAIVDYRQGKGWDSVFVGPSEELQDAVILTLRLFMQDNERISIRNTRRLYMESVISSTLRADFAAGADHLNAQLDSHTNISIKEGEQLSYRDVLYIFVYGSHAHTTARWHRLYRDLKTTPFFPILQHDFVITLAFFLRILHKMSLLNKRAIAELEGALPNKRLKLAARVD